MLSTSSDRFTLVALSVTVKVNRWASDNFGPQPAAPIAATRSSTGIVEAVLMR